jgi:mevalonate kinase
MTAHIAYAPGKIILFGEHSVVYGQPAIALPVQKVRAKAKIFANPTGNPDQIIIDTPDLGKTLEFLKLPERDPLFIAINEIKKLLKVKTLPSCRIQLCSEIPIAAGLGSGAAISVALIKALSSFLGMTLEAETVSNIAYQTEIYYHGTPSGIDNSVIAHEKPMWYIKGFPFEPIKITVPLTFVIADSGIKSETGSVVGDVRQKRDADPVFFNNCFEKIGKITKSGRKALEAGHLEKLGRLMNENHELLKQITVSNDKLDHLVESALKCGALGAKLSGAGRGGNMIALAEKTNAETISNSLTEAGAVRTIITTLK